VTLHSGGCIVLEFADGKLWPYGGCFGQEFIAVLQRSCVFGFEGLRETAVLYGFKPLRWVQWWAWWVCGHDVQWPGG
jgi:hypothetical protein